MTEEPKKQPFRSRRTRSEDIRYSDDGGNGSRPKDPTQNVLDSLNAAIKRIDDLSVIENTSIREVFDEKIRRINDIMELRAEYTHALEAAESKRIDAIRIVDVNAVSIANERAAAQATILQNQVATSAETLRALVATTAATVAAQLAQTTTQITERLSVLERAQYEFKGSSSVADPATSAKIDALMATVEKLSSRASQTVGATRQSDDTWKTMLSVWSILVALAAVLVTVIFALASHGAVGN